MKTIISTWREMLTNAERIIRLARYEKRAKNNGTVLGQLWEFLTPLLQIAVYWFVFSVGLRIERMSGGVPYSIWMTCGIIPWFCISGAMTQSSGMLTAAAPIVKNLNIPLTIIPAKSVTTYLIDELWMMVLLFISVLVSGIAPTWHMLEIVYYFFCMVVFLLAFSLFSSALGLVIKDFGKILNPLIRLLFYVSSAIISLDNLPDYAQKILKLNPCTYIIMGYRNCMLYGVGFWESPWHTLSFWSVTLLFVWLGSVIFTRTRARAVDLL